MKILGKSSGHSRDKLSLLQKSLITSGSVPILQHVLAYLQIEKIQEIQQESGDHHLFIVEVKKYCYLNPDSEILTTDDLYAH